MICIETRREKPLRAFIGYKFYNMEKGYKLETSFTNWRKVLPIGEIFYKSELSFINRRNVSQIGHKVYKWRNFL